jgi:DNA-binding NtrC family response regulator
MNILVVDDERVQLESLRRGLRSKKYKIIEALSAEQALEHFNNKSLQIDIVITDHALRGLNGIQLLREIRKKSSAIPVIMMSAYSDKELVIEALKNRCNSFIEKPFTLDNLIQEIDRLTIISPKNKS